MIQTSELFLNFNVVLQINSSVTMNILNTSENNKNYLTLCFVNFILRRFLRKNLRLALIVYRVVGAALLGNFFHYPFLFHN